MKNIKKNFAVLLTICMFVCGTLSLVANAASIIDDINVSDDVFINDENELMPTAANSCPIPSAITSWSNHALDQLRDRNMDQEYLLFVFSDASPSWNGSHGSWNYTDGTVTICVNPQGGVTTVYWNYD